ncbi:MAG: hypothetical protein OXQ90_06115 [Gammaproteobacteria bacterium]|nr:hypothetical protein [Gammaproteobacteria bacterium]
MFKARFRIHRSRAFSCPALVLAALSAATALAQGEARDCDELPEADRQLCRMMRACAAIDDPERRRECFRTVAEMAQGAPSNEDVGETVEQPAPEPAERSATAARGQTVVSEPLKVPERVQQSVPKATTTIVTEADSGSNAEERSGRKRTWGSRVRSIPVLGRLVPGGRRDRQSKDAPVSPGDAGTHAIDEEKLETAGASSVATDAVGTAKTYEILDLPKRFAGTVSAIHDPGRNRRLVALDGRLLFVSDRAGEGRLKVGDEVRVEKASGLFGEKYRITGPSRRPFNASRIRCGHPDLSEANRRRCQLLSR